MSDRPPKKAHKVKIWENPDGKARRTTDLLDRFRESQPAEGRSGET